MTVKFDKLAEGLGLDQETKQQIVEAWSTQLSEARKEISAELREEFAQKFEHDKTALVGSMDQFLTQRVKSEIEEFAQDKQALAEQTVRVRQQAKRHMSMMEKFILDRLAHEVQELHQDRKLSANKLDKLDEFVKQQLGKELKELSEDKKNLVKQRVALIAESKKQVSQAKSQFVKTAAAKIEENLNQLVRREITQYRDDIDQARKNDFGQRIFEAFAGEFLNSHLNENSQVKKLQAEMQTVTQQLEEAQNQIKKHAEKLNESQLKLRAARDQIGRERVMGELLLPLGKKQREVMTQLLENVQTANLRDKFNRYLPSVLNEESHTQLKTKLTESSKIQTGDRKLDESKNHAESDEIEIDQLRKLAGISGQQ